MISNPKRLLPEFVGLFALQIAIAKYPFVLAGETVPFTLRELIMVAALSIVGAILIENMVYRIGLMKMGKRK